MSDKLPAFQFYPGDWRKDPGVQSLDYEARGIWHELLCIMHESSERGRLVYPTGDVIDDEGIAQILGIPEATWKQTRSKLISRGVAAEDENGILYNRRMCREEAIRDARREAGRKGGQAKQTPSKSEAKGKAKRGSSSSSSSSNTPLTPRQAGGSEMEKLNPRARGESPRQVAEKIAEEEAAIRQAEEERQRLQAECRQRERDAWTEIEKADAEERERNERRERWPELYPEIEELDFEYKEAHLHLDSLAITDDPNRVVPCGGRFEVYDLSSPAQNLMRTAFLRCPACGRQTTAENPRAPDQKISALLRLPGTMREKIEHLLDERAAEFRTAPSDEVVI